MLEASEAAIAAFGAHERSGPVQSREMVQRMQDSRQSFEEQADNLYRGLDLHGGFPPLTVIALPYLQALLLAHHLKIMIRKKVFGHFMALSRIGSAKGGRQAPAG
jgi:hypothetical protein